MTGLRIGLVCPYSFDRPGGVQNHVLGLARALRELGHHPAVLAPGDLPALDPELDFTSAGPALPVPYNGSIARVSFGPVTAGRVRRWLRDGEFDLVHLHEPITPSISLQALGFAETPVVATYHTATPRSRTMQVAGDALRRLIEKIDAGIAVSEPARDVVVRHLGRDPLVIPNGFDHASFLADPPPVGPWRGGDRPRITFLGRLDEPRKGLPVLLAALPAIRAAIGEVEVCLAGHGTPPARAAALKGCRVFGGIDETAKRDLLARTDVFVAPQVARESFGIVVLEALAAGAEVVASDLPAFVDLLRGPEGHALGGLFRRGDAADLAAAVAAVLRDDVRRQPNARSQTLRYDWARVAPAIAQVYAAVASGSAGSIGPVDPEQLDRVRRTWTALDDALIRRARRALEVSGPDVHDPRALRVHQAALAALAAATDGVPQPHRERAESDLSRRLAGAELSGLRVDHDRAALARRLHNDAVAAAVRTRRPGAFQVRAFEMAES
ncbi:MAG TPA: glycosyltransferase family 4 protein [Microlunatus sp.]